MAYQKQKFVNNSTVLTAEMMDHIEAGIVENESNIEKVREKQRELNGTLSGITLGIHTDGLIYIFIDDKPVGVGVEFITTTGGDVVGYVDSANNIVLTGNLADGTYNLKYEKENGETVDIGDLVLDSNVYYSITNNLTNCTNGTSVTSVVKGSSYSATISANSGYELSFVRVTMGGTDITSSAVIGGTINIANVTGNLVITAEAEEKVIEVINQIPISTDASGNLFNGGQGWKTGYRLSMSSGNESALEGYECTGFIPAVYGDVVRIKGIAYTNNPDENKDNIVFYNSSKTKAVSSGNSGQGLGWLSVNATVTEDGVLEFTLNPAILESLTSSVGLAYIRVGSSSITSDSIITINQEIV